MLAHPETRRTSEAGVSLTELMVSITIMSVIFGATAKFASDINHAREVVDRNIQIDSMRWYVRDSLDCAATLGVTKKTKLPLNCADFSKSKGVNLKARAIGSDDPGMEFKDIFEKTAWKFRAYCENNGIVVEYAPRNPMKVDEHRKNHYIYPATDLIMPREMRPINLAKVTKSALPKTLGFAPLSGKFKNEGPEKCPATNSLGAFASLAIAVVKMGLNTIEVANTTAQLEKKWPGGIAAKTLGVKGTFGGLNTDFANIGKSLPGGIVGLPKIVGVVQATERFAVDSMGKIAEEALKRGGLNVLGTVIGSVASGQGVDAGEIAGSFGKGALDSVSKTYGLPPLGTNIDESIRRGEVGLWEMANNADSIDSRLSLATKMPMQLFVVVNEVQKALSNQMEKTSQLMSNGLAQGFPDNESAKQAVNSLWATEKYIREEAVTKTSAAVDKYVGDSLRNALTYQILTVRAQVAEKFDAIEAEVRASPNQPHIIASMLQAVAARKRAALLQIEQLKQNAYAVVEAVCNELKNQFLAEVNSIINDPKKGIRALVQQYLADLQANRTLSAEEAGQILNGIDFDMNKLMEEGKLGTPIPPDGLWADLFEGGGLFCREFFNRDPMRDFEDDGNPCPYVSPQYPVLGRTTGGRPVCCREVTESGVNPAICAANEVSILGGAECSSAGQPVLGQEVARSDVLPGFRGRGLGIAFGFMVEMSFGGVVPPWHPQPLPHVHTVQGNAKIIVPPVGPTAMTVNQVYARQPKRLGGFLRANSYEQQNDGRVGGAASMCFFANKRYSRDDDWTDPRFARHGVTSKALCCPVVGVEP